MSSQLRALAWRPWWGRDVDGDDQYPGCPDACPRRSCEEGSYAITPSEMSDGCPMHLLRDDGDLVTLVGEWRDWERGLSPHWPDGLSAAVVEAVRLLDTQTHVCQEACIERSREAARRK